MTKEEIEKKLLEFCDENIEHEYEHVLLAVKKAYNLGIKLSAENVKLKEKGKFVAGAGYSSFKTKEVIDKKSILKLRIE